MASDWSIDYDAYNINETRREEENNKKQLQGVKEKTARDFLLDEAKHLITGDRNNQYGPPHQDFTRTAALWTALGFEFNGRPVESHHVALAMIQLKSSRLAWQPEKFDSWADIAGYSGCGWECVVEDTA